MARECLVVKSTPKVVFDSFCLWRITSRKQGSILQGKGIIVALDRRFVIYTGVAGVNEGASVEEGPPV